MHAGLGVCLWAKAVAPALWNGYLGVRSWRLMAITKRSHELRRERLQGTREQSFVAEPTDRGTQYSNVKS
eukprot:6085179-Amphidinium_carterae.1